MPGFVTCFFDQLTARCLDLRFVPAARIISDDASGQLDGSGGPRRGLERIGGTVGGGIFAAVLAVLLHNQLVIAAVLFPLSLLAIAVLPLENTSRTSAAFARLEVDRMWPKVWQVACTADHVAEPGDYFEYRSGRHSVLIVRGDDGIFANRYPRHD